MVDKSEIRQIGTGGDAQQMAQIREILFGDQNRRFSEQLNGLEKAFEQQQASLREAFDQQLRQAIERLQADLEKQAMRQQAGVDGLDNALRAMIRELDDKITLVDSDLQDSDQRHAASAAQQQTALDGLRQSSVDRMALAELLEQVARSLRGADTGT